jgi:polysaccharide pyruvyl transferase WcaK-like protein
VENDSGQITANISDFGIPNVRRLGNKKTQAKDMFEFISSCDLLVTSSFHAAYWATLFEIPVIGIPTSVKFHTLQHSIPLAKKGNWIDQLGNTRIYPAALNECIEANANFIKCLPDSLKQELNNGW